MCGIGYLVDPVIRSKLEKGTKEPLRGGISRDSSTVLGMTTWVPAAVGMTRWGLAAVGMTARDSIVFHLRRPLENDSRRTGLS
ncbi:MAG: hypothetical protein P8Z79_24775 [Sedimentisphaerales bacterium]